MKSIVLQLDETTLQFYQHIADVTGLPIHTVLSDALFKLAGELSFEALSRACS